MNTIWKDIHENYQKQDWINKPSIFAEQALPYLTPGGTLLELGAGQAQDGCYFAKNGMRVTATDLEDSALELARQKAINQGVDIAVQKVDLRDDLPFGNNSFDVVYAHLSLHYFDYETTRRLIGEIERVLKPGGTLAFLVNSVHDPEYGQGDQIEPDYFKINEVVKRYFSETTARKLVQYYDINLLDGLGETYKDAAKGVHNLVRFIGKTSANPQLYKQAVPFVAAIIERNNSGAKELLLQTRWQPHDQVYSGTFEFPAGALDMAYENIFDTVAREIQEETNLTLKAIKGQDKTKVLSSQKDDEIIGFRPFCCTQQLKNGKPWIGFVFICEVESGEPKSQLSEAKDVKWVPVSDVKRMFDESPNQLFGLELPAWDYYFNR